MKWALWGFCALIFALWASWAWAGRGLRPLDDIERARASGQFAALPGAKIHYRLTGPEGAPLIVMVHGYSTPGFIFEQNAEALRVAGFRVLQFDHLGRGWSDRPASRYDTDFYDWELVALLDALQIKEPAGFVGLSMGGPIVAEFAVRHPERVTRIFLLVPAGFDVTGAQGFQASLIRTPVIGDWLWRMVAMKSIAGDPQYDETGLAPEDRLQGDVREQMNYKGYGRALLSTFRHFPMHGREDTYAALSATGIAVSAVFGDADPTVLISSADKLKAAIPDAKVSILEGADHGLNYKRHRDVNPILTGWFELDGAGR
ncbi:MAG: alpha/beta hydrolase [Hyphomonas sp.]|uniref:alpha/beta hydrolase n=1 Tax=Hyphomonas sp. TaxID=87 RepID=UPI0034A0A6C9